MTELHYQLYEFSQIKNIGAGLDCDYFYQGLDGRFYPTSSLDETLAAFGVMWPSEAADIMDLCNKEISTKLSHVDKKPVVWVDDIPRLVQVAYAGYKSEVTDYEAGKTPMQGAEEGCRVYLRAVTRKEIVSYIVNRAVHSEARL